MAKKIKAKIKPIKRNNHQATTKIQEAPSWVLVGLAGLGLLITGYLTIVAWLSAAPAFCTAGGGCTVIQSSRWSTVIGLPLSFWGFLLYGLIAYTAYRPAPLIQRWKRVWYLSLIGLVLSLYLTAVGLMSLDAVCGWCLASLATVGTLFIANAARPPAGAPDVPWWNWLLTSAVAGLIAVGALHLYYNSDLLTPPPDPRLAPLAAHLQTSGAKFYGASWCTSCQRQKQAFGEVAQALPYVECSPYGRGGPTAAACTQMAIENFPTWIIDGERKVGVLEPEELAQLSGFAWHERSAD